MTVLRKGFFWTRCLILVFYLCHTTPAICAEAIWNGSESQDLSNENNWNALPADGDTLIFGTAGITANNDTTLTDMTIRVDDSEGGTDTVVLNGNVMDLSTDGIELSGRDMEINTDLLIDEPLHTFRFDVAADQTLTLNGDTSGRGGILKTGDGTMVMKGSNFASNGVRVSSGTLVGNTGNLNKVLGIYGGALVFDQDFDGTHNTNLMGISTGTLVKRGSGTVSLSNAVSFSGTILIEEGAFSVTSEAGLGNSDPVTLSFDGGALITTGSTNFAGDTLLKDGGGTLETRATTTFSGVLSGSGSLTKTGSGTLTLTGTNTYTGATVLTEGTLSVAADSNLGNSSQLSFNGGTLLTTTSFTSTLDVVLNAGGGTIEAGTGIAHTITGDISGSGSLTKTGTGTLTLSGTDTHTGGTAINGGTLTVQGGEALSDTGMITLNGGILDVDDAETIGNLSGTGGVLNLDAGLTTNTTGDEAYAGTIQGSGSLTKTGAGTLTLYGTNTHVGGTAINQGTLVVGADDSLGGASGALSFDGGTLRITAGITMNRDMTLNGSGGTIDTNGSDSTISGTISGSGSLTKTGAGMLTIVGNHTYTGGTLVDSGILRVNGTLASPVVVGASGVLEGLGISGETSVSGVLAPGNSIGTITTGNLSLTAGSVYEVEIDADGNGDRTIVNGTVDLGSATLNVIAADGTYAAQGSYLIIDNDGVDPVTGTFGAITSNLAFLTPTVSYTGGDGNDVVLTMTRNDAKFSDVAVTENQKSVAGSLETLATQGDLDEVRTAMVGLTAPQARNALDQMSGAGLASFYNVNLSTATRQMKAVTSRISAFQDRTTSSFAQWRQGPLATADRSFEVSDTGTLLLGLGNADLRHTDRNWGIWAQSVGVFGDRSGNELFDQYSFQSKGIILGADNRITPNFLAGVSLNWMDSDLEFDSLDDTGSAEGGGGGFYGAWTPGPWQFSFAAGFGRNEYETRRHISFNGIDRVAQGEFEGNVYSAYMEASRAIDHDGLGGFIQPLVSIQTVHMEYKTHEEAGAGSLNLHVDSHEETSVIGSVGVGAVKEALLSDGRGLILEITGRWAHEFVTRDRYADVRFFGDSTGAGAFSVKSSKAARDMLIGGFGVTLRGEEGLSLYANYDAALGHDSMDHSLSLGLQVQW